MDAEPQVLPILNGHGDSLSRNRRLTIALVGNPNAGKTSLFNRISGLRAKTANLSGTTVESRQATLRWGEFDATLIDLPGLYSLEAASADERIARDAMQGTLPGHSPPDVLVLILDATNLERNLFLAGQALELGRPTVAALNMIDLAQRQRLSIDVKELSERLGCEVVPVSARTGEGVEALGQAVQRAAGPVEKTVQRVTCNTCKGCQYAARYDWAEQVRSAAVSGGSVASGRVSEAIDRVLTHRIWGVACFAAIMVFVFFLIFALAQYPMEWIDAIFGFAETTVAPWLPEGDLRSLATDGVLAGVGSVLVFLPQICLLFFLLALLEDTGYMARAALVMDRIMHRVGLPGKAFVPMLSAHACAIPAIMSTRVIEDRRDRLTTILVLPLLTCSARLPVYAMVTALLFPHEPLKAGLLFAGAYALGIFAALIMAWIFRRTLLKGATRPLVIELPNYRAPSLRNAVLATIDRALVFIKTAGTVILAVSLVMWALASYPKAERSQLSAEAQLQLAAHEASGDQAAADHLLERAQLEGSYAGRLGRLIQPVFAPLGFDDRTSVGVITSFVAREVVVSTLSVLYGLGADGSDKSPEPLHESLRAARRADGSPAFTTPTCLSLLVFYVLAMQCLSTQAVTRRETGTWKWPLVQVGYMTVLAYTAALITYQTATWLGA